MLSAMQSYAQKHDTLRSAVAHFTERCGWDKSDISKVRPELSKLHFPSPRNIQWPLATESS